MKREEAKVGMRVEPSEVYLPQDNKPKAGTIKNFPIEAGHENCLVVLWDGQKRPNHINPSFVKALEKEKL